jgi:hypothetical protein
MKDPVYRRLATALQAHANARPDGEWRAEWRKRIDALMSTAPSGAGLDNGTKLDWDLSHPECLVFDTAWHHMNDAGMYAGWTEHRIRVKPSLLSPGFELSIRGRNRNGVVEIIHDRFSEWLESCE